jgi:hypothetical protein
MKLYASITDSSNVLSVNITESHDAAVTVATFMVPTGCTSLSLGDFVEIAIGYSGTEDVDWGTVFKGYVKKVDKASPDGTISITAHDVLVRAVDYFVVNSQPEPYIKQNIETGDLIKFVLEMAGLTDFDFDDTRFIFATGGSKAEINLVNAYDYCKQLSDLIAWNLWAESDGVIYLKNRKSFPMDGSLSQPGEEPDRDDPPKTYGDFPVYLGTIPLTDVLAGFTLMKSERDLRNRIVIYGGKGVYADAERADSYDALLDPPGYTQVLPADYYKAVCLSSLIITDSGFAQDACDYNLTLLNRVNYDINIPVIGRHYYHARRVVTLEYSPLGVSGDWYIYACDHEFSKSGYVCNLTLKK